MSNQHKIAAEKYNMRYSNATYAAVQRAVITDLYGSFDQLEERLGHETPNRLMNAVTDAASEICDWPGFEGGIQRLLSEVLRHPLSDETLDLIVVHLKRFQNIDNTYAEDFRSTVKAMRHLHQAQPQLLDATGAASDIHNWQGRSAHDLLASAHFMTEAADLLLQHHTDTAYIAEKLQKGLNRLNGALEEGMQYSDTPSNFDLSL